MNEPDNTYIHVNHDTGEVNVNIQHKYVGLSGHFARASRQANVKINWMHYLAFHKQKILKNFLIVSALLLLGYFVHWLIYIPLVLFIIFLFFSSTANRNSYLSGDLGPAIVIDQSKGKIAVLTDVSLGSGDFPIIRIKNVIIPEKYNVNGQRLTVAGGYQNTHKYDHWNFYEPQPVVTATNDESVINESLKRIPNAEWIKLEAEIKRFENIPLEGYYPIDIETSNWKGRDLEAIHWNNFGKEKGNLTPDERKRMEEKEELKKKREAMPSLKEGWQEVKDAYKKGVAEAKEEQEAKKEARKKEKE